MLETIACDHDGLALAGQIARPAGAGPHPAVMVMHTAHGLSPMMQRVAGELAGHGYVAVATDMYGGGHYHRNPARAGDALMPLLNEPKLLRARTLAWLERVRELPEVDGERLAAIGYCFGGLCVLELARSGADLRLVVSYHGLLTTSARAERGAIRAEVVAWCGALDPYAPLADVDALRAELIAAGARWQVHVLGAAAHSFTDPDAAEMDRPGIAYDETADRVSWAATLAQLEVALRPR
jgi:dienelactone hydrolase